MAIPTQLDHLIYAAPDLEAAVAELESRLGVRASPGGKHPGIATRNYLLSLSDTYYLEIIGPDPEQPAPDFPRPFGIDDLEAPRLVTWAIKESDLEGRITAAKEAGYDPGQVMPLSRQSPTGLLEWRLTMRQKRGADGLVPFLIDWKATPSPALSSAKGCSLVELRSEHPDPERAHRQLAALGVELDVSPGDQAAMIAVLATPNGQVELR